MGKDRASRRGTWGAQTELPGTPTMLKSLENVQYSYSRKSLYASGRLEMLLPRYRLALTSAASHAQPRLRYYVAITPPRAFGASRAQRDLGKAARWEDAMQCASLCRGLPDRRRSKRIFPFLSLNTVSYSSHVGSHEEVSPVARTICLGG